MKNTVNNVRDTFINYFKNNGHTEVNSAPLLPRNDPSLLFVNSGMAQFKNVFTGQETRNYTRAVTSQKCVRAGGKHNDLDNVGFTARHHTFFEMLGSFSFNDYFKEEAIEMAWTLLTKELGLPVEKLLVTIYASDDEAYTLWKKIANLPDEKIIRIATDDNFWRMGDLGPCGPASEIFYDHGDHLFGDKPGTADEDGDRFIEIWNLVFMQHNQETLEKMTDLPNPCIDTGAGLERLSAVLQGTHDNYETDLMRSLIASSAQVTGVESGGKFKTSHRIIVDHLRAMSFLIADGILPSNEGRGYVLRRIMRRAMRHAHMMGCDDPIMHKLVPSLIKEMGGHFTELATAEKLIVETLKSEETRFKKTIDRGLHLLNEETSKLNDKETLSGDVAFKLFDTYGFPLDLTQDVLKGEGRKVDTDGFNKAMEEQRQKARKSWTGSGDSSIEKIWFELAEKLPATEFLGYSTEISAGNIVAIIKDGQEVDKVTSGDDCFILTNQTPFYAESGGQVGDKGTLFSEDNTIKITVTDTQKKCDKLHAHYCTIENGDISIGDSLSLIVDSDKRDNIRAHHSATHLLHAVMREHFGEHVTQKGSLVSEGKLRFDFSHPGEVTIDDLSTIERKVNDLIRNNTSTLTKIMSKDDASADGAMALFGEKYDDEVRVVSMGDIDTDTQKNYSVELCGGIHVNQTGDIGLFKITANSTVAANVKRVEAVAGKSAISYIQDRETVLNNASSLLSIPAEKLTDRIQSLLTERRNFEREIDKLRNQIAVGGNDEDNDALDVNGIKFISKVMVDIPAKNMRSIADDLNKKIGSGIVTLIAVNDGKAAILVSVSNDLTDDFNAVDLIKMGVKELGGNGGGGRPDFAQAGGPNGDCADQAVQAIKNGISTKAA